MFRNLFNNIAIKDSKIQHFILYFALNSLLIVNFGSVRADTFDDVGAAMRHNDPATALRLLKPLAVNGNPRAQRNMGYSYGHGLGVEQNVTEAAKWYRKAAEQADVASELELAILLANGSLGARDFTEAASWLQKAAEKGNEVAQYNLGIIYINGQGVKQNYESAAHWLELSAKQGYALAQCELGYLYGEGYGVPKDYGQAANEFKEAAVQGLPIAEFNLGNMFHLGNGVVRDDVSAYLWYNLAAASGLSQAATNRDLVAGLINQAQIATAQEKARDIYAKYGRQRLQWSSYLPDNKIIPLN